MWYLNLNEIMKKTGETTGFILTMWYLNIEDQGEIGSCTAAFVGLLPMTIFPIMLNYRMKHYSAEKVKLLIQLIRQFFKKNLDG